MLNTLDSSLVKYKNDIKLLGKWKGAVYKQMWLTLLGMEGGFSAPHNDNNYCT